MTKIEGMIAELYPNGVECWNSLGDCSKWESGKGKSLSTFVVGGGLG
ncbi:hypothetical protein NOL15_07160 [Streptococcus suis]|uniref:Uncharacterized protein n=1 Tax=Streptococcus suis TaxID=1307 RepID=A0A9X4RNR8_STRSU|nr:hypothetical protein [Streptococcus suis]